jgi:AcrR family transcriptional regulator
MNMENIKQNSRKAQAEKRRLQILETALTVFASNGFKGTSIKDIAEAAGISQGLMYHYFTSKDDLLEATVEHHSFLPQMRQILVDTEGRSAQDVLNDLAMGFLKILDSKAGLVRILLQEIESNPMVKKAWSSLVREGVSLLREFIESRVAKGELRPHKTEVTARSVLGIIFMYHLTQDILCSSQLTREEFVKEALNIILKGTESI